jgi:hypothetical protein
METCLPGTKFITEIVKTTLHTVLIKDNLPVSILLIAPSGGGKSQTLLRWKAPWVHVTGDITSQGLFDLMERDTENKLRTILLPDFNLPLSHKASVTNLTVANMLSLLSEGIIRVDDGREKKEIKHKPISFISGCTPDMYFCHYRKWKSIGLIRRFLLINYDYSPETRRTGRDQIKTGKTTGLPLPELSIGNQAEEHSIITTPEIESSIEVAALELAKNMGYNIARDYKTQRVTWHLINPALEFSPMVTLRCMTKAHAYMQGRMKVDQSDVEFLFKMLAFTKPDAPAII